MQDKLKTIKNELAGLINSHSLENGSNTPDFILAAYLLNCLTVFDHANNWNTAWHSKDGVPADWRENGPPTAVRAHDEGTDEGRIKHMVDRFLQWKLPENFNPDGGISFTKMRNEKSPWPAKNEPVGTNLLDAMQAEEMVRYMLDGIASASHDAESAPPSLKNPEHPVDELAQRIINESPHTSSCAAYRETARRLYDTINPVHESTAQLDAEDQHPKMRAEPVEERCDALEKDHETLKDLMYTVQSTGQLIGDGQVVACARINGKILTAYRRGFAVAREGYYSLEDVEKAIQKEINRYHESAAIHLYDDLVPNILAHLKESSLAEEKLLNRRTK